MTSTPASHYETMDDITRALIELLSPHCHIIDEPSQICANLKIYNITVLHLSESAEHHANVQLYYFDGVVRIETQMNVGSFMIDITIPNSFDQILKIVKRYNRPQTTKDMLENTKNLLDIVSHPDRLLEIASILHPKKKH